MTRSSKGRGSITERKLKRVREVAGDDGEIRTVSTVFDVAVRLPDPADPSRYSTIRRRGFLTRKEADKVRTALLAAHDSRKLTVRSKGGGTFADYIEANIEERLAVGDLRLRTALGYRSLLRIHLRELLGQATFADLSTPFLNKVVKALRQRETRTGKKLSAGTVRQAAAVLAGACGEAVRAGLLAVNPMPDVKLPAAEHRRWKVFSPDLVAAAIDAAPEPFRSIYLFTATSGLRRSEVAGLCWRHVDLDRRTVLIDQGIHRVPKALGGIRVEKPKSAASNREIPIGRVAVEVLRRQRLAQAERFLALGITQEPEHPVFDRGDGTWCSPDTISHYWERARAEVGADHVRFQDLRGFAATAIVATGFDAKTASELLGHSQVSTTLRHYVQELSETKRQAVEDSDAILGGRLR